MSISVASQPGLERRTCAQLRVGRHAHLRANSGHETEDIPGGNRNAVQNGRYRELKSLPFYVRTAFRTESISRGVCHDGVTPPATRSVQDRDFHRH